MKVPTRAGTPEYVYHVPGERGLKADLASEKSRVLEYDAVIIPVKETYISNIPSAASVLMVFIWRSDQDFVFSFVLGQALEHINEDDDENWLKLLQNIHRMRKD